MSDDLKIRLEQHKMWLLGNEKGQKFTAKAGENLSSADLRYANLSYADLSFANLLAPLLVEAYAAIDLLIHRLNEVNRDYVNANIGKQVVERDMEKAHKTIVKINQFTQE